jgi:HK97 family phage portal protein
MALKLFSNKYKELYEKQQEKLMSVEREITENNQLMRSLFEMYSSQYPLNRDSHIKDYVNKAFEGNPDVYGLTMKLATKAGNCQYKIVKTQRNGKEVDVELPELRKLIWKPNFYQNGREFRMTWHLMKYITGASMVYGAKLDNGINAGKVDKDGLLMMPTQNVYVFTDKSYAGGWRKPISYYELDSNQKYEIAAENVWHERFPALTMTEGENLIGQSPLKAALDMINTQNYAHETTSELFRHKHPPGVIYKEVGEYEDDFSSDEQEKKFRSTYARKYLNDEKRIPMITLGKVGFAKIGFDNMRDLQVLETSKYGLQILARVFGVPPQAFGDMESSIYNNMITAWKAIWEDRLIPDIEQYWEGFNEYYVRAYGENIKVVPDFSNIEALQDDLEKKSVWISRMYQDGVVTGDEYRDKMGLEETNIPELQTYYTNMNRIPLEMASQEDMETEATIEESDKFYNDNNFQNKM